MDTKQIYNLVNGAVDMAIGDSAVVSEDLSNLVDIGTAIFNANATEPYLNTLLNRIGKTVFVNRIYKGFRLSVLRDRVEYGSILQKVSFDFPEAKQNETWAPPQDGTSYDPFIYYKSVTASVKYYNKNTTFEVPLSITERILKQSFINATEMGSFLAGLQTQIENFMVVSIDQLTMYMIDDMIAETMYAEAPNGTYTGRSGVKAVNLLHLYNTEHSTSLTAESAITTPEFIRFASYMMGKYKDRMGKMSKLFNIGGKNRFTPEDRLNVILLSDFKNAASAYLESDTYHDAYVKLPNAETVPYWQGSGTGYSFSDISSINVKSAGGHDVSMSGILGVMFDEYAVAICNEDPRTTSIYNPKIESYTNWHKMDCRYLADTDENFVVFYVA